ncbi:N-acetylmuramoyl-L-alanine amidase, partial [candidate division KSB1 bacterium]|nr:N-acetylmuramoyl-L-alanine amidase [candidate division KSB1 bacterium]
TAVPSKPLSSGEHNLFVNVVNIKGNHSLLYESRFMVDIPPAHIVVTHSPGSVPPDRITPLTISATVIDKNNAAVKDSTSVHIKFEDDSGSEELNYTKDGVARFYYSYFKEGTIPYTIRSGDVSYQGALVIENRDKPLLLLTFTKKGTPNERLRNVLVGLNGGQFGYTNGDGNISFENLEQGEFTISANLPGYYPANLQRRVSGNSSHIESVNLEPMYSSILFGKRILIDPEFGGLASGSVGPSGLRAADENMETARYLVNLLKAAGADSRLTINPGEDLTPYSRVRLSNEFDAQLFVSIRHSSSTNPKNEGLATYAYPTSVNGKRLGALVLNSMTDIMNSRGAGPIEAADYVLQQTGCPAVIINLGNVSNPEIEEELYASRRNRLEAYTVFTALLKYYAGASSDWGEFSGRIVDSDGAPVGNAVISLDKTIVIQSDSNGRFKFIALENREYSVSIQAKGYSSINDTFTISNSGKLQRNFTLVKIK